MKNWLSRRKGVSIVLAVVFIIVLSATVFVSAEKPIQKDQIMVEENTPVILSEPNATQTPMIIEEPTTEPTTVPTILPYDKAKEKPSDDNNQQEKDNTNVINPPEKENTNVIDPPTSTPVTKPKRVAITREEVIELAKQTLLDYGVDVDTLDLNFDIGQGTSENAMPSWKAVWTSKEAIPLDYYIVAVSKWGEVLHVITPLNLYERDTDEYDLTLVTQDEAVEKSKDAILEIYDVDVEALNYESSVTQEIYEGITSWVCRWTKDDLTYQCVLSLNGVVDSTQVQVN